MTSELSMPKWAVISSQGCEATSLTHEEARRLVHRLASEDRRGLCIISDEAAKRMPLADTTSNSRSAEPA